MPREVPKFNKGRPNTPQKIAYTYKSKLKVSGAKTVVNSKDRLLAVVSYIRAPNGIPNIRDKNRPNTAQGRGRNDAKELFELQAAYHRRLHG